MMNKNLCKYTNFPLNIVKIIDNSDDEVTDMVALVWFMIYG